jgi:hypothetical protein
LAFGLWSLVLGLSAFIRARPGPKTQDPLTLRKCKPLPLTFRSGITAFLCVSNIWLPEPGLMKFIRVAY